MCGHGRSNDQVTLNQPPRLVPPGVLPDSESDSDSDSDGESLVIDVGEERLSSIPFHTTTNTKVSLPSKLLVTLPVSLLSRIPEKSRAKGA